jgi:hypothetical protein
LQLILRGFDIFFLALESKSCTSAERQDRLGLLHVPSQQLTLQFRYLQTLLKAPSQNNMSSYLYELLCFILQLSYDCPSPQVVLLFTVSRLDRSLTGFHPFSFLFQAVNCCLRDVSLNPTLSQATCLNLPLADVCHIQEDNAFSFSRFICTTRVAGFFIQHSASGLLRY